MSTKEDPAQRLQLPIMEFITLFLITISLLALGNFAQTVMYHYQMKALKDALDISGIWNSCSSSFVTFHESAEVLSQVNFEAVAGIVANKLKPA